MQNKTKMKKIIKKQSYLITKVKKPNTNHKILFRPLTTQYQISGRRSKTR